MEITGIIEVKKSDNKALKLDDGNWYNMNENVVSALTKASKGNVVTMQYEKKGTSRYVSKLSTDSNSEEQQSESPTAFACEVCGKELKDGKFKKCYMCNKKGATAPKKSSEKSSEFTCEDCGAPLKDGKYKKCYPCGTKAFKNKAAKEPAKESSTYIDKTAQIQRGNALNAAASVASTQQFENPDVANEFTIILAERFLDWLRAE